MERKRAGRVFKKKHKLFSGAYVKRQTQGTSNEISFSVLDAISEESSDGAQTASSLPLTEQNVKATMKKANSAFVPPINEIKRRKRARRRRQALIASLVIAVVAVAVGFAATTIGNVIRNNENLRLSLFQAIEQISATDEAMLSLDNLIADRVEQRSNYLTPENTEETSMSEREAEFNKLAPVLKEARAALENDRAAIESLKPSLTGDDSGTADQAITAIDARLAMIEEGSKLVQDSFEAERAVKEAYDGWQLVISADTLSREAAVLASQAGQENTQRALELDRQAKSQLEDACAFFNDVADHIENSDLEDYVAYCEKRIEATGYAIAADQAYIDRNKEALAEQTDLYTKADAEATELAEKLSGDPSEEISRLMEDSLTEEIDSYAEERKRAGQTDAYLREYLGDADK